jgi:hypothetical protein
MISLLTLIYLGSSGTHPTKRHSHSQVGRFLRFFALVDRNDPVDVQSDPDPAFLLGLILRTIVVDGVSVDEDLMVCYAVAGKGKKVKWFSLSLDVWLEVTRLTSMDLCRRRIRY